MKVLKIRSKMGENGFFIRDKDLDVWRDMLYKKGNFCEVIASFDYGCVLILKCKEKYMSLVDEELKVFSTEEEAKRVWNDVIDKDKYSGYKILELSAD